ncbi:MAG: RagB/SusD family nutrient uptake outer membrane protein [Flavipsychrobacter sp.]|nr:RagB/SusD family nutrient uptake outer membrane protein [Flavipsychrobacter sp.]
MRIIAIGVLVLSIFASSCNKEKLAPVPPTNITEKDAFSTPQRISQQVLGMYSAVKTAEFFAGRIQVSNELRGGQFLNATLNVAAGLSTWQFTLDPSSAEVRLVWNDGFAAINMSNIVFEGIEASSAIDEVQKKKYFGESRFIRALASFALVQLYARPYWDNPAQSPGIPLRLTANKEGGNNDLERASVEDVYKQILEDLNYAEENLPALYPTAYENATRAHKNTAIALKTRVYLYMRNYAKVVEEANKIVSSNAPFRAPSGVANQLMPDIRTAFAAPYTTLESVFSFPYSTLDAPTTIGIYFNPSPNGSGHFPINPAGILSNTQWGMADIRRTFNQVVGTSTWLRKWPKNPSSESDYIPCIRYSEILLNLAEALARSTNELNERAIALLNAVRQRSDVNVIYEASDFATVDELVEQILVERKIELLGEGFGGFDRMRLGLSLPAKGTVPELSPSDIQYIWPIPLSELLFNPSMTQNNGY